jgi:flagellar motor component MotA
MSEPTEAAPQPSLLAHVVAHMMIGLLVGVLTKAVFRQKFTVAIVAAVIGTAAHYNFDAPVARKLSELGI